VKSLRAVAAVLLAVSGLSLAACGDPDTTRAAPTTSAAPAPAASSSAPVILDDLALCKAADGVKTALASSLAAAVNGDGQVPPALAQQAMAQTAQALTAAAGTGANSKVAVALQHLSTEAAKAAASADPMKAVDGTAFTKAGEEFDAACKAAGFVPAS
jgi:hypothetical protein